MNLHEKEVFWQGIASNISQAIQNNIHTQSVTPISGKGYKKREVLYNLYHQLNHLNLFGGGYLSSCQNTLNQLT